MAAASGDADMDDSSDVSGRHSSDRVIQKVDEDAERSGDVCVGAGKQDDIVFWTTSTTKDEKSAAKFHYIKNCQRQSCRAFNCLSSGINMLAGGRPIPPEMLPPSDLPSASPVNGIL